jgi:Predicted transmembrane sensor domain
LKTIRTFLSLPLAAGLGIILLVFLGILGLSRAGYLEPLELGAYDWLIRMRPTVSGAGKRIALITITEEDIRTLGRWPIPDHVLAQTLERLTTYQPRAVGLDLYRDIPVPPGREVLDAIFKAHPKIIVTMMFGDGVNPGVAPPPVLKDTERVGFNDIPVDPGGIVRRALLFLGDQEPLAYAFALRLALLYLQAEGIVPQPDPAHPEHIRLGPTTIRPLETDDGGYVNADARGYQFLLDFRDATRAFPHYSLTALLSGRIDPTALKDKIVLLGVAAESVKDFFYTPRSRALRTHQEVPGVALHAQIAAQLLRSALDGHAPTSPVSEWREAVWILILSVAGGVFGLRGLPPARFALVMAGGLLILCAFVYGSFIAGWWIPLIAPALAWLFSNTLTTAYVVKQEKHQRALMMGFFAKHVSSEIAKEIWQHRHEFMAGGRPRPQKLTATVLFTDVCGYTTVSEKLEPQDLMDLINEYLAAMTSLIAAHSGVVIRFIGDAILAAFGVPVARRSDAEIRRDAVNAVECALAMQKQLIQLNRHLQPRKLPFIGMRIGINTGPMAAGSIGTSERMEYSLHGDTVNTAARLESFDKEHFTPDFFNQPCRILISEVTLGYLNDRFATEKVGQVRLRGKDQEVNIFRVR